MPWDYAEAEYRRQADADTLWRLERVINYGLDGRPLEREVLREHLPHLRIPEERRAFLELLLWGRPF